MCIDVLVSRRFDCRVVLRIFVILSDWTEAANLVSDSPYVQEKVVLHIGDVRDHLHRKKLSSITKIICVDVMENAGLQVKHRKGTVQWLEGQTEDSRGLTAILEARC